MQQKITAKSLGIDRKEWNRLRKLTKFEEEARSQGHLLIAGIDEVGRGPLAGPVVAAACVIPEGVYIPGVDDSKKLLPEKRRAIFEKITADSRIQFAIGIISHLLIDEVNIYQATILAMLEAVDKLAAVPDLLLVDGLKLTHPSIKSQKIIGGDGKAQSIAAASIIAKETRDDIMRRYHLEWPQYGFDKHKGYSTPEHLRMIDQHGPCPLHRKTFASISFRSIPAC